MRGQFPGNGDAVFLALQSWEAIVQASDGCLHSCMHVKHDTT